MLHKVLFVDTTHPILPKMLEEHGMLCDYFPELKRSDYLHILHKYFGLIIRSKFHIDREVIDRAGKLAFIGRVGAGMDNIDLGYAQSKNILCFNSPEGNRDALAEHTLGMILSLLNNLKRADDEVKNGIWRREENRGSEIMGKTLGIVGFGNMGSAVAQRLKGFDCSIIAYDKYRKGFQNEFITEVSMDTIFRETDILSLHVPLTEETTYLFNKAYINDFKKPIYLINTSRGMVVNTSDLAAGLKSGQIRGACLDVLEYEDTSFEFLKGQAVTDNVHQEGRYPLTTARDPRPEPLKYLQASEKVILTPHIAGWSEESKVKLAKILADKIITAFSL